ncbi:micro-fibrillar-associated protein 1 [Coniochaeta sp. 2T2.1]|nr:micro-fibrillar-associated protein 1 [Coniochaeta sp. 2T2.1]
MPPPKRMTANPVKPARYRAGKPTGVDSNSDSDSDSSDDEQQQQETNKKPAPSRKPIAALPKALSAGKIISTGAASKIDYKGEEEARRAAAARARAEAERKAREEGFVTDEGSDAEEEEEGSGSEEEGSGSGSEEESSSSEEEAPRRLMIRPKFIPKSARNGGGGDATIGKGAEEDAEREERERQEEEARRKAAADALVEEQIAKRLAARAAGKKHWEDSENEEEEVDDTDDVDPEAEYAAWKLRELKRIRREREAIEEREREREEIERRRNLTEEERKAEDEAWIAKQKEEKEGRGKMAYMQKYFHKGAFYQDESSEMGLDRRDIMGAKFADDVKNRELLPAALQMRDMTKLGRKGATKYRDLKSEDTGRWGELDDGRPRKTGFDRGLDERFQPDHQDWRRDRDGGGEGPKGSNAIPLGDRRGVNGAPDGPRKDREGSYRLRDDDRDRRRERSRSRSPRRDRHRDGSRDRRRDGSRERHRDRDDHRERRKRESSRDLDRHESDKRRRVDA